MKYLDIYIAGSNLNCFVLFRNNNISEYLFLNYKYTHFYFNQHEKS